MTDGWIRLLLVGGGIAAAVYFFGPQIANDLGNVARQVGNMAGMDLSGYPRQGATHPGRGVNFEPPFDPFGLRPDRDNRGAEYAAEPNGRLRLPPDVGNARGYQDGPDRFDRSVGRGGYQRRECRGSIWSDRLDCGEPPAGYGRR